MKIFFKPKFMLHFNLKSFQTEHIQPNFLQRCFSAANKYIFQSKFKHVLIACYDHNANVEKGELNDWNNRVNISLLTREKTPLCQTFIRSYSIIRWIPWKNNYQLQTLWVFLWWGRSNPANEKK